MGDSAAKPFGYEVCHRHFRRIQDIAPGTDVSLLTSVKASYLWSAVFDLPFAAEEQHPMYGVASFKHVRVCVCEGVGSYFDIGGLHGR